jgi:aspartate/methionine/tyrosine aminotransferase
MQIPPFKLERYFAEYEFKVKYLLSPSDCESLSMNELLQMADAETLEMWNGLKLGYTESAGHPVLRREVSHLYESVPPENVLVAAPEEAILIALQSLLEPGDHVISIFPAYQSLYEIPRTIGCDVSFWRCEPTPDSWTLDVGKLESLVTERTHLAIVNFPHNPTGYLATRAELEAVVEWARGRGIYVLSDEMYRLLEYEPSRRLPPVCDLYDRGISLSGLSKSFALPGLRIGWLATRDGTLPPRWSAVKDYTTICSSAPSEILGIAALRSQDRIIARNLAIVQDNLVRARQLFARHSDQLHWLEPQAGSVAFPQWRGDIPVDKFCQEMLDQNGVMIVPGSIFDYPGNHFRLGLGRRNLPQALELVDEYLK